MLKLLASLLLGLALAEATVHFNDDFSEDPMKTWVESTFKGSDAGKWGYTSGKFYNDAEKDKGLQTSQDAKFYGLTKMISKPFSNKDKPLVIQFTVKHEQQIDCGGGYIKLMGSKIDQKQFHGETPYHIMFGPDICGIGTKKVHVIFNYKGKNLQTKKDIRCKDDEYTHLYTLIVKPDNTYEVLIDNEKTESGELEADWEFLPAKKINDPNAKKPEDWDDREKIDDPNDKKPDDYDKPKHVPDPKAKKPDDWDDEMDGEWEPPMVDNPDYKGDWKPKQIDNPKYKGPWVHPQIDNPEYKADPNLYLYEDIGSIGFDLWQVKSGTIFDNILVTDDPEKAKKDGEEIWRKTSEGEKKMKEKQDEEQRKKEEEEEKKRKEEEEKKKKEEEASKKDDDSKKTDEKKDDDKKDDAKADDKTEKKEEHDEL